MQGDVVATGLAFPEGPVWHDGSLYLTEIAAGVVSRWTPDHGIERVATTGGGPNGATFGRDGALYVTQNGGMTPDSRTTAGIQRVSLGGGVTTAVTEVDGITLDAPNDLAFGDDGRLYFTDPRGAPDPAENDKPGRIFSVDLDSGDGKLVVELGPVFPNGIVFAHDGSLLWSESFSRRVMIVDGGRPEVLVELPDHHYPDGMCVGEDGRLYVASTYAHCVSVIENGRIVDRLLCGDGMVTNCCFAGTDLFVTESRHGTLWRFPIGVTGLALRAG